MTIVLTGGGSGGHITPILAVAEELKRRDPKLRLVYVGQVGDALADIPAQHPSIDTVYTVRAGKFRRYHGEGLKQLFDLKTVYLNARDSIYVLVGIWQSYRLMHRLQPALIFTRGGFVSVPVAIGGRLQGIPYITHDSDSTPSLANRLIAKWAVVHAVALPSDLYPYPKHKTKTVGIPVSSDYKPVSAKDQVAYRSKLGIKTKQVVLVTGGGNGAQQLNRAVVDNAKQLLSTHPNLTIVHIAGRALEAETREAYKQQLSAQLFDRVIVIGFTTDLYMYSGAADVIIARGGATNLAEFALQGKACLIIPSEQLIWNVRNTDALVAEDAIRKLTVAQSEQEGRLAATLAELLDNSDTRYKLAKRLSDFAQPHATAKLADLIQQEAEQKG